MKSKGNKNKQDEEENSQGSDEDFDVGSDDDDKNDKISIPVAHFESKFLAEKEEQGGRPAADSKFNILNLNDEGNLRDLFIIIQKLIKFYLIQLLKKSSYGIF